MKLAQKSDILDYHRFSLLLSFEVQNTKLPPSLTFQCFRGYDVDRYGPCDPGYVGELLFYLHYCGCYYIEARILIQRYR